MDLSGQFISLSWFLSCDNKNLEQQGVKQQKSYSSVQLKQVDLQQTLSRHGSRLTLKELSSSSLLALPFLNFLSPPFGCPLCKIGLVPTISERECKWAYALAS